MTLKDRFDKHAVQSAKTLFVDIPKETVEAFKWYWKEGVEDEAIPEPLRTITEATTTTIAAAAHVLPVLSTSFTAYAVSNGNATSIAAGTFMTACVTITGGAFNYGMRMAYRDSIASDKEAQNNEPLSKPPAPSQ